MAIEVTEEMRQAVYQADCDAHGHMFDLVDVLGQTDRLSPAGLPLPALRARDATQLPHLSCRRCRKVWLVIDEPGGDYAAAVVKVAARFGLPADDERLRPRPAAPPSPPRQQP